MRVLAIETSSPFCSVALFDRGKLIAERHEQVGRGHAERLIPWISELPSGGRADEIRVGCGPGSFTGSRIAIAAAKGLGIGWGIPVRGVSSLALVVAGHSTHISELTVAVEAGHGELFVQRYSTSPVRSLDDLRSCTPEQAACATDELVIGNAAERLVSTRGWGMWRAADGCAANMLRLDDNILISDVLPIYGRAADAKPMA